MKSKGSNNDAQTEILVSLRSELSRRGHDDSRYPDAELQAFLRLNSPTNKHNTSSNSDSNSTTAAATTTAATAIIKAATWKEEHVITIADIASFLRTPSLDAAYPDGCIVCLEDMQGDCARDKQGRPILVAIGMPYGNTAQEVILQAAYAWNRARLYTRQDNNMECCVVMEASPREERASHRGYQKTFRFPDGPSRELFDFLKANYPLSQFSQVHFCGLPRIVTSFFPLAKPFMSKESYERIHMNANFKPLAKEIGEENMLSIWNKNGTFQFDLDKYIEWRAQEENVTVTVLPGQGRSYTAAVANDAIPITDVVNNNTQKQPQDNEPWRNAIKMGVCRKRGSGRGLFATTKWKTKFMAVRPGCLVYFDSTNITDCNNTVARSIDLTEACHVEVDVQGSSNGKKEVTLKLTTNDRDFLFGFDTVKEADEWLKAICDACTCSSSNGNDGGGDEGEDVVSLVSTSTTATTAPVDAL